MATSSQDTMPKITAYENAELSNSLHQAGIPMSAIAQTYHDPSMKAIGYYLSVTHDGIYIMARPNEAGPGWLYATWEPTTQSQGYRQTNSFNREEKASTWADAIVAGCIKTQREKRQEL